MAAFELSFGIRKELSKEKLVEWFPLLYLACFMYKYKNLPAGQVLQKDLSFLQNLLNYHKIFETRSQWWLKR